MHTSAMQPVQVKSSKTLVALILALALPAHAQNPAGTPPGVPNPPVHITPFQPLPQQPKPPQQAPVITGQGLSLSTTAWTFIGPGPQSITGAGGNVNFNVSGRIAAVAAHPTDPNTIYVAPAGGGVWKTTNAATAGTGLSWTPLTDAQTTLSMGAIAIAPSNPLVIYAGTGEANNSGDSNYGRGILVSTDGGNSWVLRQGPGNIFNRMAISAIAVHPTDPNTVYAAMMHGVENGLFGAQGVYKSTDGGTTWVNTTSAVDTGNPYSDVKINLTTPSTVYMAVGNAFGASTNGIYESTDSGTTWTKLTNGPNGSINTTVGRISLAISTSNPLVLYATTSNTTTSGVLSVVRSDDGGSTFHDVTPPNNYMGGQGWYDQTVIVDPSNSAIVYVAGSAGPGSMLRSANSGVSWTNIDTGGAPNNTSPHVDHHGIAFDANGLMLDGDDGGIYRLDNPTVPSWTDLNGNLGTIQFQGIGLHPTDPNQVIGGSQDNGTALYSGNVVWQETDGGDGGFAKFSQTDGTVAYHIAPVGSFGPTAFFRRSNDGGITWASKTTGFVNTNAFLFYAPFVVDPGNGNRVLVGADRVYETTNGADLWTPISTPGSNGWTATNSIGAIGLAPSDVNTIYAATCCNDIWVTTNHGATWTDYPIPVSGNVADIQVDRTNATTAYAVISNFTGGGNVFETTNGGTTWTNISGNLPNEPVWSCQIDLDGTLYVGADDGVYISQNGGGAWNRLGTGFPNAQVFQLSLNTSLHILGAATHGRAAWEIATVLSSTNMTITKSHSGNFVQGQTGATYTITALNVGGVATSAAVTVTDTLPTGLTATAIAGTGWDCTLATLTCTRSDVLAAGSSYPSITLTVNIAANAPSSVTNIANVAGGGETYTGDDQANDPTTILSSNPDMTITKSHTGNFFLGQTGATYTITANNVGASSTSAPVTVTDTLPTGLTATAMAGTGWNCTLGTLTCTRSDALAGGSSYPPITLTVNVSANAPPLVTNTANVAGGGETNTGNDSASDPTITGGNPATSSINYIFPDTALAGGPAFTLSVSGSGFQSGAVVNWNGTALTTTYSFSSLVTANVPASLIASVGTASITIANPGEQPSSAVPFHIVTVPVVPTLTSVFATYSVYGNTGLFADKLLFLNGSGFQQGMTISWNGTNLGPVTSSLFVVVPLSLIQIQDPGPAVITATNPGSASSQPKIVTVPQPRTLTDIAPAVVPAGGGDLTLTVDGTGFASGDQVAVFPGGSFGLPTTFISATQLQATVPASYVASNGTLQVWVNTYVSNGAFSSTNELPLTVGTGGPILSIAKTHTGNFTLGQQNATYSIAVSNASGAGPSRGAIDNQVAILEPNGSISVSGAPTSSPTSGPVTVNEYVPFGLTLVSMSGDGWSCTVSSATCARSDVLAGGASFPAITVIVTVSATASSPLTNSVAVSGGGSPSDYASDVTIIGTSAAADLTIAKTHSGNFTQGQTGATYSITAFNVGGAATSDVVTVTDTVPTGLTATAISGTGWSCTLATATCTRSDVLAAGSSYPSIALTVNVDANAPSSVTNIANVSGGGETNTSNDQATDVTTILASNPPSIGSIFPDTAIAGGPDFTLSVNGSNFQSGAVVNWNGTSLTTAFSYSGLVTATVPATVIGAAGTASITVTNPGGSPSNAATFEIVTTPVTPDLTSVFATYGIYATGLLQRGYMFMSGSGFQQGMTISWNGTGLGPIGSSLLIAVPLSLIDTPGPVSITATNPGGSPSQPVTFTVPQPRTLTSVSPAAVSAGSGSFTLTVNGTGFASGDAINVWPGAYSLATTFISATQLQATVPASAVAANGTLQVWVTTFIPNGIFPSTNELPLTVGTGGPVLNIAKTHSGNFSLGEQNATYTVTVSNASGAGPTIGTIGTQVAIVGPGGALTVGNAPGSSPSSGAVTVSENVPAGLTLVSMAGDGWNCTLSSATCTRSDVLAGGASFPAITVTVNVSPTAASPLTNFVSVSGGGAPNAFASDVTIIATTADPDMTITKTHTGNFTQGQIGATYTVTAFNVGGSATSDTVTVTDTLPTGLTATAMAGTGWSCTVATLTCTRTDVLASGSSYPSITLTVNVAANAPSSVTNIANVSGGGETNTNNDQATDVTTILASNPVSIFSIFPDTALAGGPTFTLSVSGSGFVSGAVVNWNGTPLTTTFNGLFVTASVPASLVTTAGTASISVTNPGGQPSNAVVFAIVTTPVVPTLTSQFASYAVYGATGLFAFDILAESGFGFEQGMTISWNGTSLGPVGSGVFSPTSVAVPFSLMRVPGAVSITATNPGGSPSQPLTLTIPPLRTLTSISPATVAAGGGDFTLTVNGTGFASGDNISVFPGDFGFGGSTTFISSTELQTTVPAATIASNGTLQVWVNTNTPSGSFASTNQLPLTVGTGGPILSITKTHVGNFAQGQQNATYTVTVSNASGAGPTLGTSGNQLVSSGPNGSLLVTNAPASSPSSGTVTVTESVPAGMTLVSMAGTGWSCSGNSCSRSDVLAGGASYPPITVTVNVSPTATSPETNFVTVSGGGAPNASIGDITIIGTAANIFSIFPDTALAGGPPFTLSVSGSGFISGAVVSWNGIPLATDFLFGSLTASVPASLIASPGTASITVTNPGGSPSTAVPFAIVSTPAIPTLTSAYPTYSVYTATGLFGSDLLIVSGSGFELGETISWNGTNLGSGLFISVPSSLMQTPGPVSITASNPGGAPSQPITFTIPPLRTLTSIVPASVSAGSGDFTLTVNGTGFASGDAVGIFPGGSFGLPTTFISTTQLQATVPASYVASNGTLQVWVNTSTASGSFSSTNQFPLTVGTGGPILSISKTHSGNFTQGEQNATYAVTVSNASGAGPTLGGSSNQVTSLGPNGSLIVSNAPGSSPTSGPVTVTESVPSGMTLVSMVGSGWSCSGSSCSRSDVLAGGASYPPITVTVNVSPTATSPETNFVSVSGGGAPNTFASDVTIIGTAASISSIFPDTAIAGGPAFTLSVNGLGFQAGAVVNWNGTPLATTSFFSSLSASVPASLIASPGAASITVTNPGGSPSTGVPFSIVSTPAIPTLTSAGVGFSWYTATGIFAGDFLSISGSGFEVGVTISWNGTNLGTGLSAGIPLSLLNTPGPVSITATNPGGAPSQPKIITVPPLRTLTTIAPATVSAGSGDFTLTVNGTGFASGDTITVWPGSFNLPTTFISPTQLQATVPASTVASNGTLQVWVQTFTASGGFTSTNELPLTVGIGGPVLSISKTHTGNFTQGQQNASYTVTVSNASGAGPTLGASGNQVNLVSPNGSLSVSNGQGSSPTSGPVTVTESVPFGMTLVSMTGAGWSCSGNSCSRSDVLAGGASYPAITVTVNVSPTASSPLTNFVNVSGGGAPTASIGDITIIGAAAQNQTFMTSPEGLLVSVDGAPAQAAPFTVALTVGSHTIAVAATQAGGPGTQFVFTNWSDSGAASHSITVGSLPATYTATFKTQYRLTTAASPRVGGTVTPSTGTFYDAGSLVSVQATAKTGYQFSNLSGSASGSTNPQNVMINGPANVVANFTPLAPNLAATVGQRTVAGSTVLVKLTLTNTGLGAAANATITGITAITDIAGSGAVTLASGAPVDLSTINPGSSATATLTFNWPSTATRVSFTVNFTADGGYAGSSKITTIY